MWRRGLLVTALSLLGVAGAQTGGTVPRELVERIVGGQNANLYVGELPPADKLGFELPLPEGARVVGSTLSVDGEAYNAAVYLETETSARDVGGFYQSSLSDRGWKQGQPYEQTGFLWSSDEGLQEEGIFCLGTVVLYLSDATANESAEDVPAQVTLQVYENPRARGNTPCDQNERNLFYGPPIPALAPPSESTTLSIDGGGGDPTLSGSSSIYLESDLSAEALLEFYDAQLLAAGWTARDGGGGKSCRLASLQLYLGRRTLAGFVANPERRRLSALLHRSGARHKNCALSRALSGL